MYRNLMVTMLLGGLWHGANWTFVCWGAYHGLLLSVTRAYTERYKYIEPWPKWLRAVGTFLLVVIGWVFFRSDTFEMALKILYRMFSWRAGVEPVGWRLLLAAIVVSAGLAHFGPNTFEISHRWRGVAALALALLFAACLVVIYGGHRSPFLYFQF
jgi:alginate O-acetyltransferase complex protein AlgI